MTPLGFALHNLVHNLSDIDSSREKTNEVSDPTGIRTQMSWMRTKYPKPLDDGAKINLANNFNEHHIALLTHCR